MARSPYRVRRPRQSDNTTWLSEVVDLTRVLQQNKAEREAAAVKAQRLAWEAERMEFSRAAEARAVEAEERAAREEERRDYRFRREVVEDLGEDLGREYGIDFDARFSEIEAQFALDGDERKQFTALQQVDDEFRARAREDGVPEPVINTWLAREREQIRNRLDGGVKDLLEAPQARLKAQQEVQDRRRKQEKAALELEGKRLDNAAKRRRAAEAEAKAAEEAEDDRKDAHKALVEGVTAEVSDSFRGQFRAKQIGWEAANTPPAERVQAMEALIDEVIGSHERAGELSKAERSTIANTLATTQGDVVKDWIEQAKEARTVQQARTQEALARTRAEEVQGISAQVAGGGEAETMLALDNLSALFDRGQESTLGLAADEKDRILRRVAGSHIRYAFGESLEIGEETYDDWRKGEDPTLAHKVFAELPADEVEELFQEARASRVAALSAREEQRGALEGQEARRQQELGNTMVERLMDGLGAGEADDTFQIMGATADTRIAALQRYQTYVETRGTISDQGLLHDPAAIRTTGDYVEEILRPNADLARIRFDVGEAFDSGRIGATQFDDLAKLLRAQSQDRHENAGAYATQERVQQAYTDQFIVRPGERNQPFQGVVQGFKYTELDDWAMTRFVSFVYDMEKILMEDGIFEEGSAEHKFAQNMTWAYQAELTLDYGLRTGVVEDDTKRALQDSLRQARAFINEHGLPDNLSLRKLSESMPYAQGLRNVMQWTDDNSFDTMATIARINVYGAENQLSVDEIQRMKIGARAFDAMFRDAGLVSKPAPIKYGEGAAGAAS